MKIFKGVNVKIHTFLTSAVVWGEGHLHVLAVLPLEKEPEWILDKYTEQ
jgi:hypothetical protein